MKTPLRKIGNSQGVLLPKALLAQIGVAEDELEMTIEGDAITLRRAPKPRSGWGSAASEIEKAGEYDAAWLDADLVGDEAWVWE